MTNLSYKVLIDTDDDGTFLTDEVDEGNVLDSSPIEATRGHDLIRALSPPRAGSFSCEMKTEALPDLLRGRGVKLTATKDAVERELFTGLLEESEQERYRLSPSIGVTALGVLSKLARKKLSTALHEAITIDEALTVILDAIGWPADKRDLDESEAELNYWWMDEADVFAELNSLKETEGPLSSMYEAGDGTFVFRNHQARFLDTRSTSPQAVFVASGGNPAIHDLQLVDPFKNVVNTCVIETRTRAVGSLAVIWSLGQAVYLAPGQTWSVVARPAGDDKPPFKDAVTPLAGTDFTVLIGSATSVTLDRTSGASTLITIVAGADGLVFTGLQLRAKLVTTTSKTSVQNSTDMSASIDVHGVKTFPGNIKPDISYVFAQDLCDAVVSIYGEGRSRAYLLSKNDSEEAEDALMDLEIGDRITVTDADVYNIDDDYYVEAIAYEMSAAGLLVSTTYSLEKADEAGYFVLDTDELNGSRGLGF